MCYRIWSFEHKLTRTFVKGCGRRLPRGHVQFGHNSFDSRLKSWLKLERDVIEGRLAKEVETFIRTERTEPVMMTTR